MSLSERLLVLAKNLVSGNKEYVIWGIPKDGSGEVLLLARLEGKPIENRGVANRLAKVLETKYGARNVRVQEMDMSGELDWMKEIRMAKKLVADDVGVLVTPFEPVLKSFGFRPSAHNARTSKDFASWMLDLDPAKYEIARMVVTFLPDKVEIVAGNLREDGGGEVEISVSHPIRGYSPVALRRDIRSNLWTVEKSSGAMAASELLRIAKSIVAGDVNTLNGISNQAAKRYINRILSEHTKGFFHDQSWEGVHRVWKALDDNGIDWVTTDNEYQKDGPSGMPTRKQWKFEVNFVNNKDKPVTLYGVLIASGAGAVDDVFSRYDLTAYMS